MGMSRQEVWAILGVPGDHSFLNLQGNGTNIAETEGTMVGCASSESWQGNNGDIDIIYDDSRKVISKHFWHRERPKSLLSKLLEVFYKVRE